MSDLKNFLRDVGYFGVGAAAIILEAGGKAVKSLVRKGEETLRENQETVDEIKRKAKEAGEKIKEAAQKVTANPEPAEEAAPAPVDASALTPEERAELRRQLDEADQTEVVAAEEAAAQPVVPDAIYRTEEPAPEEEASEKGEEEDVKPEETING